ncbi:MAG: alpha/beta fold hydrolase [Chloroflexi bacterium]|nr:alpha/beta fold hydrolase [Chloroflexota bacterium]
MVTPPPDEGAPLAIPTERGPISCRYHPCPDPVGAVLLVGGFDGGFDGPADGLYPDLAHDLLPLGIATLRLDFRLHTSPGNVDEGTYDVLQGLAFLEGQGVARVGLVGHSFGAAVAINAGARSPLVTTVVTLSAQTYGTRLVNKLSPRPLLLIHGADDQRLPPSCSEYLYARALEPKELVILPGTRHSLRQRREEVRRRVVAWLARHLRPAASVPE